MESFYQELAKLAEDYPPHIALNSENISQLLRTAMYKQKEASETQDLDDWAAFICIC